MTRKSSGGRRHISEIITGLRPGIGSATREVGRGMQLPRLIIMTICAAALFAQPSARLTKEVRHELVMLPYYGVFDNLAYRVDGDRVTLFGQVVRPTLKSDAENVVKRIE